MKQLILSIVLSSMAYCMIGQVTQQTQTMALGSQTAFTQEHKDASEKHVEAAWKDVMKKYGKPKFNRKSKNWESLEATIPTVSNKPLDVYLTITEGKGMTSTAVFVDNGMQFISADNNAEASDALELFLNEFADATYRLVVEDELKAEEKNLDQLEKEQSKLEKENEKLHEDIAEYERKIAEAENAIVTNIKNQDDQKFAIEEQKSLIEKVKEKLNSIGKK